MVTTLQVTRPAQLVLTHNSALNRRGRVFADRFHSRVVGSTLDVKCTLLYVLNNARRHGIPFTGIVDPHSSAAWFDGWHVLEPPTRPSPVARPRSWQLVVGWKLHGRLSSSATPRAAFD